MAQKIFNTLLALAFIILVALFVYKTVSKPEILTSTIPNVNSNSGGPKTDNPVTSNLSKEELNAAIREYIMNNPEDILASLEQMQSKKEQNFAKKASTYLKENKKTIEEVDNPPVIGNKDGDISIVIFYDYNCGFCKKANAHIEELLKQDPGVKVILRPLPILGGTSLYAVQAALAIQKISQSKFPAIHSEMMQMQVINKESIKKLVSKYDIDYSLVDNEVNSYSVKQLINTNFELAKELGVRGAPSYVINGNFFPGLIPVKKFKSMILEMRSASK